MSGGKDSTAMLLLMLEKNMPIDCVFYADTGMEFPELEAHMAKLDSLLCQERGIHIITLRHPHGFERLMFDNPLQQKRAIARRFAMGQPVTGYGWPGMKVRWCTSKLKTELIQEATNRLKKEPDVLHYIGIAADEARRCKDDPRHRYPLMEWGVTETQALQICYSRGFDFGGLYEIYHRASCWCCPLQRIGELRKLRNHHPELWARLLEMDNRARAMFGPGPLGQFKQNWSVARLEERFAREETEKD
nr:phosphoadenosine phosphosulfate reductase family protein [Pseudoflavonifractor sp. 524-17]